MGNFDAYNPNFNYGGNSVQNIGMPRPMQAQPIMQNCYMPIQVRDEADAKSYPVAANTTVSLMSASADFLWIKSTNASGTVVSFRTFKLSEVVEAKPEYVTKADFDAKFEAFEKRLFESLGGK